MKAGGFLQRRTPLRSLTGFLSRCRPLRSMGQREPRPKPLVPKNLGISLQGYKKIPRNRQHMARIAALGCLICRRPAQAHHVDILTPKNVGPKVTDYLTAPLCPCHHTDDKRDSAHGYGGERAFWQRHGISIGSWISHILRNWYPAGSNRHADAAIDAITKGRTQ